ncbi:hypothetical protein K501DRAFT_266034 [Backusella circina FSU 941]|nr:hypothetical protein K501DRAFT_266034 [Backusella circina FSU 941]
MNDEEQYGNTWINFNRDSKEILHQYQLSNYLILQCEYSIKCQSNIPEHFYKRLGLECIPKTAILQLRPLLECEQRPLKFIPSIIFNERSCHAYDHVKGTFSVLSMFNFITSTFRFANIELITSLRVSFLHARKNRLHLWMLEMPTTNVSLLNRIAVYKINECFGSLATVIKLGNFMLKLKSTLEICARSVSDIRTSHEDRALERFLDSDSDIVDIRTIIKPKILKPKKVTDIG